HALRRRRLLRSTYEIPEDRPHPHVHGCNLGVRGDAYLDAGGWPGMDLAEGDRLWNAIRERGWAVPGPARRARGSVVTAAAGRLRAQQSVDARFRHLVASGGAAWPMPG